MPGTNHLLIMAIAIVLALSCGPALAQGGPVAHGEALVSQRCAMCHGMGRSETSPNPVARPFRTLGRNYSIEALEEPLRNGALLGHPMMPGFSFSPRDANAIVRYLQSIQVP
jgi:cytochrome c